MKDSYFPLISIFLISLCNIYSQNLPVARGFQKFKCLLTKVFLFCGTSSIAPFSRVL